MDFYVDIGVAVILRVLKEQGATNKYRRALIKLYRAIGEAYRHDSEFQNLSSQVKP
jgi:hypothetical protein